MNKFLAFLLLPTALYAGDNVHALNESTWLELVSGKTVEYSIDGKLFVREYYWPGRNWVTMEVVGQQCFESRWDFNTDDFTFCFHNGPTACFWHMQDVDRLYVMDADPGINHGSIQEISAIKNERLACSTAPIS